MNQLRFGRWTVEVDAEATRAIMADPDYPPGAEGCGCALCRNFLAQREGAYPPEVRRLFEDLGVDYRLEVEVVEYGRQRNGKHVYGAWFHFVGRILEGADAWVAGENGSSSLEADRFPDGVTVGFSKRRDLLAAGFGGRPVVQLDVGVELPWVLEDEEAPGED